MCLLVIRSHLLCGHFDPRPQQLDCRRRQQNKSCSPIIYPILQNQSCDDRSCIYLPNIKALPKVEFIPASTCRMPSKKMELKIDHLEETTYGSVVQQLLAESYSKNNSAGSHHASSSGIIPTRGYGTNISNEIQATSLHDPLSRLSLGPSGDPRTRQSFRDDISSRQVASQTYSSPNYELKRGFGYGNQG